MNKTLLTILIILVLIGGGYFILNPSTDSNSGEELTPVVNKMPVVGSDVDEMEVVEEDVMVEDGEKHENVMVEESGSVVTYTNDGYSPKTLTIKAGDTVTFNNEGSPSMWVASAQHPTHQAYPEFDQLEATGAGTSYEFTFDKTGDWKYHNHVRPNHFGTIIVE